VCGIARIDASGRICERAIITALGWADGDRLTFTAESGAVTARRDPGGMVTLPASAYITIPAALRHRCVLEAGDQVLLAALPCEDALAAYWLAVVDQATARSRMPKEESHDHRPGLSGRVAAGGRGRGAAGPEVDGPVPGGPDYCPRAAAGCADLCRVCPCRVRHGHRRRPQGVRLLLEPMVEQWGGRRLDEPTPSEIKQLVAYVRANAAPRRHARGGRSAAENLIAARTAPQRPGRAARATAP
jgi:hypothetical protein